MKPHRTDALSLTFGLIFLGAVGVWALYRVTRTELPGIGWFVAGGLIVCGAIGLLTALRTDRPKAIDRIGEPPESDGDQTFSDISRADPTIGMYSPALIVPEESDEIPVNHDKNG